MNNDQSIIIKRVKKAGHCAHGGVWKIAFADFMTAAMAFFMMLWLLGGSNDDDMKAMAEYFRDPSIIEGAPFVLIPSGEAGQASDSIIDMGGFKDAPKPSQDGEGDGEGGAQRMQEMMHMIELKAKIEQKIAESDTLKNLKEQLKIDITPNGLQIQVLDDRRSPMFESGVDLPREQARHLLKEVGAILAHSTHRISIAGHTDAAGFAPLAEYTNWELSADRANAARRLLLRGGVDEDRIAQAVGLADTVPFDAENPYNPRNRRISIIVLNKDAEERLKSLSAAVGIDSL